MLKLAIIVLVMLVAAVPFWFVHMQSTRHHGTETKKRRSISGGGDGPYGGGLHYDGGGDCGGDGGGDSGGGD